MKLEKDHLNMITKISNKDVEKTTGFKNIPTTDSYA